MFDQNLIITNHKFNNNLKIKLHTKDFYDYLAPGVKVTSLNFQINLSVINRTSI
jgi:hypothetical protein